MGDAIPLQLGNLVGKTYLFKVQIERENYVYKHDTYKVLKIVTNLQMIKDFEAPLSPKVCLRLLLKMLYILCYLIII